MTSAYAEEFERTARLAFSMWNRDPASPSFGSFDRQYWGWKYKDFSDATLQYAVRLAVEYASARGAVTTLPALLAGFAHYCARIQRRDGSFDQCYPYERTPGVVFDILSTLIYVRESPYLESGAARGALDRAIGSAARFALATDETHGAIANHFAEYAWELFHYAKFSADTRARAMANRYLDRALDLYDREEGWFEEYAGPDAGYQTRTLRYLVKIAELGERADLWPVIAGAARFVEALMMPDGSLHPMLGSRSTALVYPYPFEALARRDAQFGALAGRVREAWNERRVPVPSELDFCNAIRLADDAREAAPLAALAPAAPAAGPLPGSVDFARAGIAIRRAAGLAVYVNWRLGGALAVYSRAAQGWTLAHEDSGYLIRSPCGSHAWLTRMPGAGALAAASAGRVELRASFHRSLHDEVTPFRLIVLRLLNLSVLRVQWVADWFRRIVVRRLMAGRVSAPVRLGRTIEIGERAVTITDVFEGTPEAAHLDGPLYRCRRVTGIHMASSRYFQDAELAPPGAAWMEEVAPRLAGAGPFVTRIERP
ncbi:MAG: hypothetical protein IT529_23690 [Burkholderiales bacterium]|nr:hypothetical protein [Burkholderiales bacterium]